MNTDGAKENVGEKPGYIYEVSADLGNQKNFSVRGNFPVAASAELINSELDKLLKAIGRQQARACLPAEEAKLRQMERQLKTMIKNHEISSKKYTGHKTLPVVAQEQKENAESFIVEQRVQIEEQKDKIAALVKEAE